MRWFGPILLVLAAGVALTVLVAWLLAPSWGRQDFRARNGYSVYAFDGTAWRERPPLGVSSPWHPAPAEPAPDDVLGFVWVQRLDGVGASFVIVERSFGPGIVRVQARGEPEPAADVVAPWDDRPLPETGQVTRDQTIVHVAGWPMLAMLARIEDAGNAAGPVRTGWVVRRDPTSRLPIRTLPFGPVWPGFAVNTLFWSVIAGALLVGLTALRGRIRRWRGRCATCAYPLHDLATCPECGTPAQKTRDVHERHEDEPQRLPHSGLARVCSCTPDGFTAEARRRGGSLR